MQLETGSGTENLKVQQNLVYLLNWIHQPLDLLKFKVKEKKNEVVLEIAPKHKLTVKPQYIRKANITVDETSTNLISTDFNDLIWLYSLPPTPETEEEIQWNKKEIKELDLKEIIGMRVNVLWKGGRTAGWWKGTIIGYTRTLNSSLIKYDVPTLNVDPRTDYYQVNLKSESVDWKQLVIPENVARLHH